MQEIKPTPRTIVNRMRKRGSYDRDVVHAILDRSLVCHVGVVIEGAPRVLPTLHARIDDSVFIHGAASNRMIRTAAEGVEVCLTATLVDGLVMARSAFHHSVNYRSVVIFGRAIEVTDREAKLAAMRALVEHIAPGRWERSRQPNPKELAATSILELPIEEASAKVRADGVVDDEADYALPIWAGVIPLRTQALLPIADARLTSGIAMPPHISEYRAPDESGFSARRTMARPSSAPSMDSSSAPMPRASISRSFTIFFRPSRTGRRESRARSSRARSRTRSASGFTKARGKSASRA